VATGQTAPPDRRHLIWGTFHAHFVGSGKWFRGIFAGRLLRGADRSESAIAKG
jgi:hypothetical protein